MKRPANNAPGEAHNYSNTNYILLAMIIEKVTGTTYQAVLATLRLINVFDPSFPNPE